MFPPDLKTKEEYHRYLEVKIEESIALYLRSLRCGSPEVLCLSNAQALVAKLMLRYGIDVIGRTLKWTQNADKRSFGFCSMEDCFSKATEPEGMCEACNKEVEEFMVDIDEDIIKAAALFQPDVPEKGEDNADNADT